MLTIADGKCRCRRATLFALWTLFQVLGPTATMFPAATAEPVNPVLH